MNDYKELKRFMFPYYDMECEFLQLTEVNNALSIINDGYFYSRVNAESKMTYDNIEMNDTTNSVMSTNVSTRLDKYVRFYMNIRNKSSYSMICNFKNNNTYGVILTIDYSSLWKSKTFPKTHIFLTPYSAHFLNKNYFEWNGINDIGNKSNLRNINESFFNYRMTHAKYEPGQDNKYQFAEVMFYDKVSTDLIKHIYFENEENKNDFLSRLDDDKRAKLADKCLVNKYYFWR